MKNEPKLLYIIRRRKDDSIVAVGTANECVKIMGLKSSNSFRSIVSKNRKNVQTTYEIDTFNIDEEEETC